MGFRVDVLVQAVFEFLREEILSAAADGHLHMELSVSDHWFVACTRNGGRALFCLRSAAPRYHDTVNQKLVVALLATEGVRASFESGTWFLDWRDEQ